MSPLFGRLVLTDGKKATSKLFGPDRRTFFIFDEINVYASSALLDLVNKSRSANVTCISATQSLSDLDFADDIKNFRMGNGVYMSKDNAIPGKIIINKPF